MSKFSLFCVLGLMAVAGSGVVVSGCKSTPELTKENALALIQARYDQQAPASVTVLVNDDGMKAGVTAKYWDRLKGYPNMPYWADFKLTDLGKKAVTLPGGGDTILWHPDSATDTKYVITVNTVATSHLKAKNAADPQDEMNGLKSVQYDEVMSLEGVPEPVQTMARLSNTKVSARKTATFVFDSGAWKLQPGS